MGQFADQIKEITGLDEVEFIKDWKKKDKEFTSAMKHIEEHGIRCLKMLNGQEHWDPALLADRRAQGRPCLVENLLPDFVNKPHGEFCMSTPAAIVEPVDSKGTPRVADILKGLLYSTSYLSQSENIYDDAFFSLIASGLTVWLLNTKFVDNSTFNVEIDKEYITNPFSVRWDLGAKRPDLSDKTWTMILGTEEKEEFIRKYGKEAWKPLDFEKSTGSKYDGWWSKDKATVALVHWIQFDKFTLYEQEDGTVSEEAPKTDEVEGRKLRTREAFKKKVWSCVISGNEVLTEPTEWPDYTEDPIIPVVIVHGRKLVVQGKIYYKSLISDGLDIQQIHNYWITAITESIALQPDAPYIATEQQIAGFEEWTDLSKKVRAMRYKHDPKAPGPPQRQQPPQISGAVLGMPQYTRQSLHDTIGLQQASLGQTSNEKSGVAITKRKQEGDAGKFSFINNMTRGIELDARIQINVFPSIMDTPRVERIMGVDGSKSLAYIKQANPETGEFLDLSVGKYDVRVTTGPTFATQRDESRELLSQLIQYAGPFAPGPMLAILPKFLKLVNAPDADEMADIIIASLPPEMQAFYKETDKNKTIPPEVLSQVRVITQQLQQLQQLSQQQAQRIKDLESEQAVKLKELESKEKIKGEELQIRREEIAKEITLKREELQHKDTIAREEMEMKVELEMTKLMETIGAQRRLKGFETKLERKESSVQDQTGATA